MYIHAVLLSSALLASIVIALQGTEALLVPIWSIVALCAALPAVVILAPVVLPKAFAAAIEVRAILASHANEQLATVFTSKRGFLPDVQTSFLSNTFTLANIATESLLGMSLPIGTVLRKVFFPAKVAGSGYKSTCSFSCFVFTFTGTVNAFAHRSILEFLAANWACISYTGNTSGHNHTSDSMIRIMLGAHSPERTFVSG